MMEHTEFLAFYSFMKSKQFNRLLYQYDNDIISKQYEMPINISANYIKAGDNVLDWSCGNGHFSLYLGYKKAHVIGTSFYNHINNELFNEIDFSLNIVDESEKTSLPFDNEYFDLVFSIGVLEHVHETGGDQLSSLKEIRRILCQGGCFLCFHLPCKYSWVENTGRFIPTSLRKMLSIGRPHSKRFDKKDITTMLEYAGFTLENFGTYNFLPRNFTRALPFFLKHNRFFVSIFNGLDKYLAFLAPYLCSQSYFVARKDS